MWRQFTIITLLMMVSSYSFGQTISVRCKFSHGQATNFDKGKPTTSRVPGSDMPDLVFDQVDAQKGTARLIGNQGAADVMVDRAGNDTIHLIEMTGSGSLNTTTIYQLNANKGASHQYPVVHSRHINSMSSMSPYPSQYLGTCIKLF